MDEEQNIEQQETESKPRIKIRINRLVLLFVLLFASALMILYVDNVRRIDDMYSDIQKNRKLSNKVQNEIDLLRTRLNYLQSPERIMKVAEREMDMIKIEELPEILPEGD